MIRFRSIAISLLLFGCIASYAVAAQPSSMSRALLPPPTPGSNQDSPEPWIGMLLMFIVVAIIITISMMPSRRGHQD